MASPTLASPQCPCRRGQSGCWSPGAPLRKYPHHGRVTEDTCRVASQGRASPTWQSPFEGGGNQHRRFSIGMASLYSWSGQMQPSRLKTSMPGAGRPRKQMTREGHPQISGQQGTLNPADVETGSAYLSLPCSSYGPRPSSLSETQPHQVNEPATGPPPPTPSGALNPLQRDRTLLGHQVWFRICEARVVSPGQYAGLGKGYKG